MKIKRSFGRRLLIGIILPVLVLFPLLGLGLVYFIETQIIIPALAHAMIDQAGLVARLTVDHPDVWTSAATAQKSAGFAGPWPTYLGQLIDSQSRSSGHQPAV